MKVRQLVYAVVIAVCVAGPARAQSYTDVVDTTPAASDTSSSLHRSNRSSIDQPSEAVRRPASAAVAPLPATGKQLGEAKAEMIVGGAAIVVGAVIGGDGGSVLMFGGAVVGLYGLWNYLK